MFAYDVRCRDNGERIRVDKCAVYCPNGGLLTLPGLARYVVNGTVNRVQVKEHGLIIYGDPSGRMRLLRGPSETSLMLTLRSCIKSEIVFMPSTLRRIMRWSV